MSDSIECLHMNHINAAVDDFDESVEFFGRVYGAQLIMDMPKEEWHACLIAIGGVIFELFAPHDDLLHARFGPHYVGVEYQVPDVPLARSVVGQRGIRIVRELGTAFHVHPLDAGGISFEFYDRSFHDVPPPTPFIEALKPSRYWSDEHPLGCIGLKRYSVAVSDLDTATHMFEDLVNATVDYHAERPDISARAVGLALGGTVVELLSPVGDGPIQRHIARHGDGIRSTVFQVRDLRQTQSYLEAQGLDLLPGDAPGSLAVTAAQNCGLLFEFAE